MNYGSCIWFNLVWLDFNYVEIHWFGLCEFHLVRPRLTCLPCLNSVWLASNVNLTYWLKINVTLLKLHPASLTRMRLDKNQDSSRMREDDRHIVGAGLEGLRVWWRPSSSHTELGSHPVSNPHVHAATQSIFPFWFHTRSGTIKAETPIRAHVTMDTQYIITLNQATRLHDGAHVNIRLHAIHRMFRHMSVAAVA